MSKKEQDRENLRRNLLDDEPNPSEGIAETVNNIDSSNEGEEEFRERRPNVITSDSPVIKRELKEIIDNFGKAHSEPAFKHGPKVEISETSFAYHHLTYTESPRMTEVDRDNFDESEMQHDRSEDTTLDGKIIEILEDSHVCHEACQCRGYTHSLSQVEPHPIHYPDENLRTNFETAQHNTNRDDLFYKMSSTSPPLNVEKVKKHYEKAKGKNVASFKGKRHPTCVCAHRKNGDTSFTETSPCLSCSKEEPERGRTNRYNYNHVQIVRGKDIGDTPLRTFCERLLGKKKKYKHKNIRNYLPEDCLFENDSGVTIPQLYKAKLRQLSGTVPERFTFKAYTGTSPCRGPKEPVDIHRAQEQGKGQQLHSSEPNKPKSNEVVLKKSEKSKNVISFGGKDFPAPKACLNFDGNEYISTRGLPERIDIYCFDHLNTSYFRTSDQPPPLITDVAMERTEAIATRFWAELFGFMHIVIAFIIAFILQLYKFTLYSIVRPLMIGLVQLTSDYFFKPLLTIIYNGCTQPLLVFVFNVAASFRDVCYPIARGIGYFFTEIATLLRAIRIIDLSKAPQQPAVKDSSC